MPVRHLPARPDPRQLHHQAKDLLRAVRGGDPSALSDFHEYHPAPVDPAAARLADAQLVLARSYQTASWPQLLVVCQLIRATSDDDFDAVRDLLRAHPHLLGEPARGASPGWPSALAEAANLGLRRVINTLRDQGASNVAAAMARPALHRWLDALRLLGRMGARAPKDAVGGAVETLSGPDFALMIEIGTDIGGDWRSLLALTLETYARDAKGKHRILEVMAEQGVPLPDTPAMALHRGRLDLLARHLQRDPALLTRTFPHQEIYPRELGCHADESLALHGAPLAGATLLHMAADYEDPDTVGWLIDRGMDVNVRAAVDDRGFGGHSALFNCVVTYNAGRRDDPVARLLLDRGADPNLRASIRKGLAFARDPSIHEYRDVTPLGWGRQFHDQSYVRAATMRLIAERGGVE